MKLKNTTFIPCDLGKAHNFKKNIKKILSVSECICFTVHPYLDDKEEILNSKWKDLYDSIVRITYECAVSDQEERKSSIVVLKNDYKTYNFFMNCTDIFDLGGDTESEIVLEDPCFIKDGEVFCYTITHEKTCVIEEMLWKN